LNLNGKHQVLVYADGVNILGGSVRTTDSFVVAVKEIGLEVNVDKSKCMVMFRDAGRSHCVKIDNSFERMEECKYLGTTLTNQNCIPEEIKSRRKLGSACYYSVQLVVSSSLLSTNLKVIYTKLKFCLLFCVNVELGRSH
jgi:hypothetical protein